MAFFSILFALILPVQQSVYALETQSVWSEIYLSPLVDSSQKAPTIFMFGGSEGGNQFGETNKKIFLDKGYHVVTIGYFGMKGTPKHLNRIKIDSIHNVIDKYKKYSSVDAERIAILGVSKGGELSLLLGSLYEDITTIVAAVPSYVVFQASNVTLLRDSSWVYHGQDVPFVPYPRLSMATIKGVLSGASNEYLDMHLEALKNTESVAAARIKIEKSKAAILLISGKYDQVWPSTLMCKEIMKKLNGSSYSHTYEHLEMDAGHYVLDYPKSWEKIFLFLDGRFRRDNKVWISSTGDK